jgi:signal transduction histidine kinase
MNHKPSIKQKFALAATALFLLMLLLVTVFQMRELRQGMTALLADQQLSLLDTVAVDIAERFETRQQALDGLAEMIGRQTDRPTPAQMQRLLDGLPAMRALFDDFFIISVEGLVLANSPYIERRNGISVADRPYYRDTLHGGGPVISEPYRGRLLQRPSVMMTAPINDRSGRIIAIAGGQIDLLKPNFLGDLGQARLGKTGHFYIVTRGERPVYVMHPDQERILGAAGAGTGPPPVPAAADFESLHPGRDTQGRPGLYGFKALLKPDWVLAGMLPEAEAFAPIQALQRDIALIGVLAALLFAPLVWLLASRLLQPLSSLHERILAMRNPHALDAAAQPSADEIENLTRDFDAMTAERRSASEALVGSRMQLQEANQSLERRVAERTAQLLETNRDLEAFSYTVAHDLRTPLRAITSFSMMLADSARDRLTARELDLFQRIVAAGEQMGQMLEGLLQLGRLGRSTLKRQQVDVSALCRNICDELAASAPGYRPQLAIAENLVADADPALLRVALQNLLDNAWKYSRGRSPARIEVDGFRDETGAAVLRVKDNGIGFDMNHAKRLFKAFERLHNDPAYPGIGLGLATVERIVRLHGGRIRALSSVGGGARFEFTLGGASPGEPA